MKSLCPSLSLSVLVLVSYVFASPVDRALEGRPGFQKRAANCTDANNIESSCWNDLNIADYLTNWNKTTPDCKTNNGDGSDCCVAGESWSTCFLRIATASAGLSCDTLSVTFCSSISGQIINSDLTPDEKVKASYVRAAIFQVHQLFVSYDGATGGVSNDALQGVLDAYKIDKQKISAGTLMRILPVPQTLGLTVMAVANSTGDDQSQATAQIWDNAVQSAPAVANTMWPSGVENDQKIQLQLPPNVDGIDIPSSIFLRALKLVMSDIPTFLAFAGNGRFANYDPSSVSIVPNPDLNAGTNTFVTSKLMSSDNLFAVPGVTVDPAAFTKINQCAKSSPSICITESNQVFYLSPSTHRQYELRSKGGSPKVAIQDQLSSIQDGNWADLELLFDGSYNCTGAGKAGGSIVSWGAGGTIDVSCLSQLPMYLDCKVPCPTSVLVGGICPFGNWKKC
ncbi:MAG: hypothetical protein Q9220_005454 [cf. Caloplaca sp. 1 TL-2023]